jgi:glycosyltransferase involved in cell wall biosynthesis
MELAFYASYLGLSDRILWNNKIPSEEIPAWLADKDFILSTSVNEGNPNCVIEGMACGLKPIVHAWPGAGTQFPQDAIFRTAEEAAQMIREGAYQPLQYRKWVEDHYSLDNIRQIHKVIDDCTS